MALLGIVFAVAAAYNPVRVFPSLLFLFMAGGAIYLLRLKRRSEVLIGRYEAETLRIAKEHGGRLTVEELAMELGIPVESARKLLRAMERRGVAYLDFEEIEDRGVEVYRFPGL
ncbi:MAG TPA: hypothetical protein ENG69_01915 [Candidatus Korarchaeota archaeon]|nr:hypothetical protein [Candidatus Korarchaeota archaeon]